MAAELAKELGVESDLRPSRGGVFEVNVNGALVFSKKALGRFPEEGEVLRIVRKAPQR